MVRDLFSIIRTRRDIRLTGALVGVVLAFAGVSAATSAAQLPTRSVQLSSASAAVSDVTYAFEFTVNAPAGAFVIDFCSNSPQIEQECLAPAGMTVAGVATQTSGYSVAAVDANTLIVTAALSAAAPIEVALEGITNASEAGLVYARIITYESAAAAALYTSTALGAGSVDGGTVAFSITDTIGVTASVMESVTFCVSGEEIGADCTGVERPVLALGEQIGDSVALTQSEVSEGIIYAQISTNAAAGVVVNLKSSALGCGGLMRAGAGSACDIMPALNQGITAGQALFGVKIAALADTGTDPSGVFQPAAGSLYGPLQFSLNFVANDVTGVTSTFGDPFLDTAGEPANNKNVALTFGASISNNTPAGAYSTDLSLIAAGKF